MATGRTNRQGGSATLTGNAAVGDVLSGKTFYNTSPSSKLTGTMTSKVGSATVITPSTADQTIPAGYYGGAAGDGKVSGDADLVAGNIKSGVNIFGVSGTFLGNTNPNRVGVPNNISNYYLPYISILQSALGVSPQSFACSSDFVYMYIIDSTGNTYRSNNSGKSWTYMFTDSSFKKIRCSSSGQYVYFFKLSGSVRRSIDYGANTLDVSITAGGGDCSADGSIVYVDVGTTLYKSTNYGANFSSTGVSCYSNSSWSSGFNHIECSDDGQTVYYADITSGNLMKSTNGLSTAGTQQIAASCVNANLQISQDGTKWGFYSNHSSGITIADSKLFMGCFNNGNYIATGMRSGLPTNATYWANLGSLGYTFQNRVKGKDNFCMNSGTTMYLFEP